MSKDSNPVGKAGAAEGQVAASRVVLVFKRGSSEDHQLAQWLTSELKSRGVEVFVDESPMHGLTWAKQIQREVRTADAVVGLLSAEAVDSELVEIEIEIAHEAAQEHHGRPRLIPVLMRYEEPLPETLAGILDPLGPVPWNSPTDNETVLNRVIEVLNSASAAPEQPATPGTNRASRASASEPRTIEPPGGAVAIGSKFYVVRPADMELRQEIGSRQSVILIKGARQIGKTSLLARGLKFARERGAKVAITDFQKLNADNLDSVRNLLFCLAESLADQLDLPKLPAEVWDDRRGPNINFERYIRREALGQGDFHLVWGLDEVDRLFAYPYASEVFGLFRSWHNERQLDPSGPWDRLTLAITYATEAHLFITDINQSPFNIGKRIVLEDFRPDQVEDLNKLYGQPLKDKEQVARFIRLVGGHPYLVRRGLYEMNRRKVTIAVLEERAARDDGIFGDHLRRVLVLLARDHALTEVVKAILSGEPCPNPESFYRLRSAGLMQGTSQQDVQPRCDLYARYLKQHLLGESEPEHS